jgi:hypothetical protein
LADEPRDSVEAYSLIRDNELEPASCLYTLFDTGSEYQQMVLDVAEAPESTSKPTDR